MNAATAQLDALRNTAEITRNLRHNVRCSVIDGSFYMVMVGLAETFFPLFVLSLFDNAVASGLVLTIPIFLASIFQLTAPYFVRRAGSYRAVVATTAWLQAIICLPLAVIAFTGLGHLWLVFVLITLYHCGAGVGGPPWMSLIGVLIPAHVRARFMAKRNRLLQLGSVSGVVVGACMLEYAKHWVPILGNALGSMGLTVPTVWQDRPALPAFGVLLLLAGAARAVSAVYLGRHREPDNASSVMRMLSAKQMVERAWHGRAASTIAVLCVFAFAMMIGSPFWHAYVREIGGVGFLEWAGLVVIWMIGRAIAVTWAGEVARNHGHRRLLMIAAVLMTPIPALWALSANIVWLAVAQLLAGMAIACWDLSVMLSVLDTFAEDERTSMLAKFGLLSWLSGTAGSWVGGSMLNGLGNDRAAFAWVFVASTFARGVVAAVIVFRRRKVPKS